MSTTLSQPLDGAQWAVARGFKVHPTDGKRALWPSWPKRATSTLDALRSHLENGGNYAIAAGPSGLLILDEDKPGELARWQQDTGIKVPATLTVATGKGRHYYLEAAGHEYSNASPFRRAGYEIDVRGGAGYVIGPGSVHEGTGALYTLENDEAPAQVPAQLHEFLTAPHKAAPEAPAQPVEVGSLATARNWQAAAIEGVLRDLQALQGMAPGERLNGYGWDALTNHYALRLVALSNHDPAAYPRERAHSDFLQYGPQDATFTVRHLEHKWQSAQEYAGSTVAQPRESWSDNEAFLESLTKGAMPPAQSAQTVPPSNYPTPLGNAPLSASESAPKRNAPLVWEDVLNGPPEPEDWILWPLVERGKQVTLFSAPKQGKSLVTLDLVAAACAGNPGPNNKGRAPIRALYLDAENTASDLRERLHAMGYEPSDLENLTYISFPSLPPLDTAQGAHELHQLVIEHRPELIVLDTLSRFIEGDENESKTWQNLYQRSLMPLKGQNIAVLRLDHTGKDVTRGERGSSAKTSDVDASYLLTYEPGRGTRTLKRELTRNGHGPERITLAIREEPLRHTVPNINEAGPLKNVHRIINELDAAGVPEEWGRDKAREALKQRGFKCNNEELAEAIKERRDLSASIVRKTPPRTGSRTGSDLSATPRTDKKNPCPEAYGQARTGEAQPQLSAHPATLKVAGGGQAHENSAGSEPCPACNEPECNGECLQGEP
ncbi:AAA family ATPase [Dermabacter hominis]